jgi:hypothetical protein
MPTNVIGHELRAEIIVDVSYPGWYRNESAIPAGATVLPAIRAATPLDEPIGGRRYPQGKALLGLAKAD